MDMARFKKLLAMHGADLSLWPTQDIKPAVTLIGRSGIAKKMFEEAERLDQMLRHYHPPRRSMKRLADKIMLEITGMAQIKEAATSALFNVRQLYVPGGGLVMAAAIGFVIGIMPANVAAHDPFTYAQDEQIIRGITAEI